MKRLQKRPTILPVGARAIRRWTQKHIEGELATAIISAGEDVTKFTISFGENGVEIKNTP